MNFLSSFLSVSALAIFSAFFPTSGYAQNNFDEAIQGAILRNDLVGPFGSKHNWDQYIDRETTELQLQHDGKTYGWEDLFSRASFFFHTDLARAIEMNGGDIGSVSTDDYTRFHVFELDGVHFLAGWLNFHDNKASIFKIAEVDTDLASRVADEAAKGKSYDLQRHHIEALLEDESFEIVFQANSLKQRTSSGELGLEIQKNSTNAPENIGRLFSLFVPDWNFQYSQQYLLPSLTDPKRTMVRGPLLEHFINQGCLPTGSEEVRFYGTTSFFYLAPSSQCFMKAYANIRPDLKTLNNIPFSHQAYKDVNKFAHSNPVRPNVNQAPSLRNLQENQRMRDPVIGNGAVVSMWSSFAGEQCRRRKPNEGDWIVLQYKDRAGPLSSVLSFDEKRLSSFASEFFGLAGWLPRNSGKFSFGSGKCPFPITLTIYVYHGDKLMGSATLDNEYAQKHLKSPHQGISVASAMNSWGKFEQFLVNEVGSLIWYYAENFR